MNEEQIIHSVIEPAIQTAAQSIPFFAQNKVSNEISFYGTDTAVLDSLSLINFIYILETTSQQVTGQTIRFEAQDILNPDENPFGGIRTLAKFLMQKLGCAPK